MKKKSLVIVTVLLAGVAAAGYMTRDTYLKDIFPQAGGAGAQKAGAQKAGGRAAVSVQVANAERKKVPLDVETLGLVATFASVAVKSRIDSTITEVHFEDGARVNEGDILFTLDSRQIEAQIQQAEGTLAKDRAQLAGYERDVARYSELISKGATTQLNLENSKTQTEVYRGTILADIAALDSLKVQKTYTVIRAPISGRISAANVKVGNLVRTADATPIATINQVAPVYVNFPVAQRVLPDLREAIATGTAMVNATMPTDEKISETGKVAMIENTVDPLTGMVTARALMDNAKETLWPGTLVRVRLTVKTEDAVVVPTVAVQRSQTGDFVFVAKDGRAQVTPVKITRTFQGQSVIESGLSGGETVVTDGQLSLQNNTPIETRTRRAGA